MAGEYIEFNNNSQPALNDANINRMQQLIKQDIQGAVSGDTLPIGAILPFGSNTIPENWLLCNGQAVSREAYSELFNTIGTVFGSGDGFTTFNLPNLQGKVVVGKSENDEDFDALGETGGTKSQELKALIGAIYGNTGAIGYLASSKVPGYGYTYGNSGTGYSNISETDVNHATPVKTSDGSTPSTLQPYIVQNYIIKAKQSAGIVATVVDILTSVSTTDALSAKQGKILNEKIEGTVLYENSTGELGNVNLSEALEEGDNIEIIYCRRRAGDGTSVLKSTGRLPYADNMEIGLDMNYYSSESNQQVISKSVLVNEDLITVRGETTSINSASPVTTSTIYILKVIKY